MKNWRRMFLLAAIMAAASAYAVPSFTPVIDGVKDAGWGATPDHSTTSQALPTNFNLDGGLYVTDDATSVYFGFDADPDPWDETPEKSVHVHIVFDIGSTTGGGNFACWGASNVFYGMPYKPEYDVVAQWNTDNQNIQYTGLQRWNAPGFNWVETELTQDAGGGGQWTEIKILKSEITTPEAGVVMNISMWLRPSYHTNGGNACLPEQATFPSDNGAASGRSLNVQFPYTLQVSPNDTVRPHILAVKQIDRTGVEILFDEPMLAMSLGNSSNYTAYGWPHTGTRYITNTAVGINNFGGFTDGTLYSVVCLSGIRDLSNNPIHGDFDSASWTAPTYSDVTFRVIDETMAHDSIEMKGSFNLYHEYDSFWHGGNQRMYDDGSHGDAIAGDHTFTLIFPLVPSAETYEWGCTNEQDDWLVVGPNQTFSIPDATPITVTYTIPSLTIQDVTVTFRCDMQCIGATIDSVTVAGSLNGWAGTLMTDPEFDEVYELTTVIPAGSSRIQDYKFRRHADLGSTYWEDNLPSNRSFTIVDEQNVYDLGVVLFDNYSCWPRIQEVKQIDRTGVEIRFDKEMSEPTLAILANYTMFGWTASSIRYTSPFTVAIETLAGFTPNTEYSVLCGQGITGIDGTPMDLAYDSAGWTSPDYADVTFEVTDQTATHDSLRIRGSWDWFHAYDATWSGGTTWLYDDGTHGDVTAGDHIFTTIWILVPSATDYVWGVEDEFGNWLVDGPDLTFNLPDINDITVTYTVTASQLTTVDATVAFLCDMQCQPLDYDEVDVAGTFSNLSPVAMSDADLNGQYELSVLIPAGSPSLQQYFFLKHTVEGYMAEPIAMRQFTILPGQTELNLSNKFFADELCAPSNLTVYRVGDTIELKWSGPDRAAYQVYEHTSPDQIAELGTLLGTTEDEFYSFTPITPVKAFYQIKTVMP